LRKIIATTAIAVLPLAVNAAKGCSNEGGGPARSASYAGDGITQFGTVNGKNYADEGASGKLKWGVTYKAVAIDSTDRQNCKWSLYTINAEGETVFVKKGGYMTAKINFGQQRSKKVYLKSLECGLWKPA
jgi:hypothetical protein